MPALHHVAFACKDLMETHRFYQDLLGFTLVHAEVDQADNGGWFRHVFYDLGDGSCVAFFDLHGMGEPDELRTEISTGLGLPSWVNHLAVRADRVRVDDVRDRLADAGVPVEMELDHGWCQSLYVTDPNGILIELTVDTPGLPFEPDHAQRIVSSSGPS